MGFGLGFKAWNNYVHQSFYITVCCLASALTVGCLSSGSFSGSELLSACNMGQSGSWHGGTHVVCEAGKLAATITIIVRKSLGFSWARGSRV